MISVLLLLVMCVWYQTIAFFHVATPPVKILFMFNILKLYSRDFIAAEVLKTEMGITAENDMSNAKFKKSVN